MTTFVNAMLLIINIVCFVIALLLGLFGIYEQIMGPADAKKLLNKLNIPFRYNQILIIWFVNLGLLIVTNC